jgi:hypothetical protein
MYRHCTFADMQCVIDYGMGLCQLIDEFNTCMGLVLLSQYMFCVICATICVFGVSSMLFQLTILTTPLVICCLAFFLQVFERFLTNPGLCINFPIFYRDHTTVSDCFS